MNITYGLDLSKSNITNFSELVLSVLEQLMKIGQEIVSGILRQRDTELLMERDASRFRRKGFRETSVKTQLESNIFTLIGNRMKGRRARWSIRGANHLAPLLCRRHSVQSSL